MLRYCQKNPLIKCRSDYYYYYTTHILQDHICKTKNIPLAQVLCHKAILPEFENIPGEKRISGFWKFNASLLKYLEYFELVRFNF